MTWLIITGVCAGGIVLGLGIFALGCWLIVRRYERPFGPRLPRSWRPQPAAGDRNVEERRVERDVRRAYQLGWKGEINGIHPGEGKRERKRSGQIWILENVYDMAAHSLNPDDFAMFECLLLRLADTRHLDWVPGKGKV